MKDPGQMTTAFPTLEEIRQANPDWTNFLFFLEDKTILAKSAEVAPEEIDGFLDLFRDYDNTLTLGLTYQGIHYHVHRFYEGLIYGRADPATQRQDGFCLCRFPREGRAPLVALITYDLPNVSARMIPLLAKYVETILPQLP